jgi:hypothetical protein
VPPYGSSPGSKAPSAPGYQHRGQRAENVRVRDYKKYKQLLARLAKAGTQGGRGVAA